MCIYPIREVATKHDFTIYELEVSTDHVHLFVGFKPNLSVSYVTQLFKGYSAYRLFREFPWLGKMWLNSYGIQTRVRAKGSATSSERDPNFALSVTERAVMSLPSDITLPRGL